MEKSQKELESLVQSQQKQLSRYETRLKGNKNKLFKFLMNFNAN